MENKVFVVIISENYDYNNYTKSAVFSTKEKAKDYVRYCIECYKADMECLDYTDEDFLDTIEEDGYSGEITDERIEVYLDGNASQEQYMAWIEEKVIDEDC